MRTRATIVVLVVGVSILLFVFGEGTTPRNPIEVESRTDEPIGAPAVSPRPVPDKEVSANRIPPDPDAILGLMMVLGARGGR